MHMRLLVVLETFLGWYHPSEHGMDTFSKSTR